MVREMRRIRHFRRPPVSRPGRMALARSNSRNIRRISDHDISVVGLSGAVLSAESIRRPRRRPTPDRSRSRCARSRTTRPICSRAAGNLSLKLGDADGAAALFSAPTRSPANARVKAGMGRLLVHPQRPGEALRLFREAAQLGANERDFASGPRARLRSDRRTGAGAARISAMLRRVPTTKRRGATRCRSAFRARRTRRWRCWNRSTARATAGRGGRARSCWR